MRRVLRQVGSLWFAAILLVLLLIAMACATVAESARGAEFARIEFYHASWFVWLFVLLSINLTAAVVVRLPFRRGRGRVAIGFVLTHLGVVTTLLGTVVTMCSGLEGQIPIAERQTTNVARTSDSALTLVNQRDRTTATIELGDPAFNGSVAAEDPRAEVLSHQGLRCEIRRYIPDGVWSEEKQNDDSPPRPAVDRIRWDMTEVSPVRENRTPALLLRLTTQQHASDMWVQKYQPRPVAIDGVPHLLHYGDLTVPLGFNVRLDRFRVLRYPGTDQPRSFESHITITDSRGGESSEHITSMNHPAKYGGFALYQLSYDTGTGRTVSVLGVARDPGVTPVFVGYIATLVGMVWVFTVRRSVPRETRPLGRTR
ncbi:MAG: cytochrome c biogenesis protein ResB [Phycisphaerae bacterium]|jgi:hypothetical protein